MSAIVLAMNPAQTRTRALVGKSPREARKHFAPQMASDPRLKLTLWGWVDECEWVNVLAASEEEAVTLAAAIVGGEPCRLMTLAEECALTSENRTSCPDCGALLDHVAANPGDIDADARGLFYEYNLPCPVCRREWHFLFRLAEVDSIEEVTYV